MTKISFRLSSEVLMSFPEMNDTVRSTMLNALKVAKIVLDVFDSPPPGHKIFHNGHFAGGVNPCCMGTRDDVLILRGISGAFLDTPLGYIALNGGNRSYTGDAWRLALLSRFQERLGLRLIVPEYDLYKKKRWLGNGWYLEGNMPAYFLVTHIDGVPIIDDPECIAPRFTCNLDENTSLRYYADKDGEFDPDLGDNQIIGPRLELRKSLFVTRENDGYDQRNYYFELILREAFETGLLRDKHGIFQQIMAARGNRESLEKAVQKYFDLDESGGSLARYPIHNHHNSSYIVGGLIRDEIDLIQLPFSKILSLTYNSHLYVH